MINPATGAIEVNAPPLTIHSLLTPDDLAAHEELKYEIAVRNLSWTSYRLPGLAIGKEIWAAILTFDNTRLDSVSLAAVRSEFGAAWSDWSEERESARRTLHDQILLRDFGDSSEIHKFNWGTASSNYDQRSGGASIFIRYLPPKEHATDA